MLYKSFLWALVSLLLVGCSQKTTRFLAAVKETEVKIPKNIKHITAVNRCGQKGFGALVQGNKPNVALVIKSFSDEVRKRRHFTSNVYAKTLRIDDHSGFPPKLPISEIKKIGKETTTIAVLERFSVDEKQSFKYEQKHQLDTNGNDYYINVVTGTKTITVYTNWRIYNTATGAIIDQRKLNRNYTYTTQALTRAKVIEKMESQLEANLKSLCTILGQRYAQIVSPLDVYISRNLFKRGSDELKIANKQYLRKDDWEGAKDIWENALNKPYKNKIRARLHYNLGVHYERNANLNKAIEHLQNAKSLHKLNGMSSDYLYKLISVRSNGY